MSAPHQGRPNEHLVLKVLRQAISLEIGAEVAATTPRHQDNASGTAIACLVGMFLFFSNKLSCLASLLVSMLGTALVVGLIWLL